MCSMPRAPTEGSAVRTQHHVSQRVDGEGREKLKTKMMVSVFWGVTFMVHTGKYVDWICVS